MVRGEAEKRLKVIDEIKAGVADRDMLRREADKRLAVINELVVRARAEKKNSPNSGREFPVRSSEMALS